MPMSSSSRSTGSAPMCLSAMIWIASRTGSSGPMVQTLLFLKASRYLTRSIADTLLRPPRSARTAGAVQCGSILLLSGRGVPPGPWTWPCASSSSVAARTSAISTSKFRFCPASGWLPSIVTMSPTICVTVTARTPCADCVCSCMPTLEVADALERAPRHALDQRLVVLAVAHRPAAIFTLELVARGFAFELALQARNQVAVAVQVGERRAVGAVELLALVVGQRVVDQDDGVLGDLHDRVLNYSTVTDLARLRGWSTSVPFRTAQWYASSCSGTV